MLGIIVDMWINGGQRRKPSTRLPALTTIDPHIDDYAKHAVDMLIDRIEGYSGPARTYTTDFTLVERASTRLAH